MHTGRLLRHCEKAHLRDLNVHEIKGKNKGLRCPSIDTFYMFFLKSHEIARWKLMALWTTNNAFFTNQFSQRCTLDSGRSALSNTSIVRNAHAESKKKRLLWRLLLKVLHEWMDMTLHYVLVHIDGGVASDAQYAINTYLNARTSAKRKILK